MTIIRPAGKSTEHEVGQPSVIQGTTWFQHRERERDVTQAMMKPPAGVCLARPRRSRVVAKPWQYPGSATEIMKYNRSWDCFNSIGHYGRGRELHFALDKMSTCDLNSREQFEAWRRSAAQVAARQCSEGEIRERPTTTEALFRLGKPQRKFDILPGAFPGKHVVRPCR
eukprot:CAMPEP_0204275512 /NCGR_PEP_ID=MMETSP0468-20130131/26141_1 /ASSEMBLY_ACC=CAM_ASM_000383 /TAXON_ID=2969 /ORGANISM="Oxyrrhis marina" /LENGTH=168 /DNA_ID=CAMNT_0051251863 /DNA_START=33 /DNA_END=536 /DNA_ORIENTATION=-